MTPTSSPACTTPDAELGHPSAPQIMRVEIWSDVACPWCYIGKRNFEAALRGFAHRDHVEVTWRSFELAPTAPTIPDTDYVTTIAGKYGMTAAATRKMIDTIAARARDSGLVLDFDRARPGNTHDAHRLLHLARRRGCQPAVKERFLRATLVEGEPIGDPATLLRLAVEAGLPPAEARSVLDGDAFAADVRADQEQAALLGITSVPFFVIDRRLSLAGAQEPDVLVRALEVAFERGHALSPADGSAAATENSAACGAL